MARGNEAKEKLINKFIKALGENFIGCYDKKYYFVEEENGEKVQIAISMTCPKTPIEVDTNVTTDLSDWDFSDTPKAPPVIAVSSAPPAEITEQEIENLNTLLAKLGL